MDMYAVGAMLYELLTERPLSRHDRARNVGAGQDAPSLSRRATGAGHAERRGDDLPEMPGKGARQTICVGGGLGRRPGALPGGRADCGAAGEESRACGQVGTAQAGNCRAIRTRRPGDGLGTGGVLWQWRAAVVARGHAESEGARAKVQTELADQTHARTLSPRPIGPSLARHRPCGSPVPPAAGTALGNLRHLAGMDTPQRDLIVLHSEAVACLAEMDASEVLRLDGHAQFVYGLDFSPDGKTLASALQRSDLRVGPGRGPASAANH